MSSKLFKYKKQGENFILSVKDSQELVQQLRNEHTHLSKQIAECERKKQLIEDKLRELSIKFNTFYQYSDQPELPHMVFKMPNEPIQEESITNQEIFYQFNDYQEYIPEKQENQIKTKRELFDYFSYKSDVLQSFEDLKDITILKKLSEQFGIKTNNTNKLKQQLKIIQQYLQNQSFPASWNQIYNAELFEKLEI
ncbi:unnamed protein product (macronuclear) [Paramecium tetraurelia]|uniref:Uncharacterized protein n=1 Tax=Paramecium tetraurelia TaxID=5888 RepID=A0DY90_PARTE|nr:uncharacterized protein GSPATT00002975001 [Paramecium tetraurelia]CAK88007.1 unnamed protein product [Paramecium tetraurelia]|eukprot:XP_001455404.1 hypothetical protein (macronuclear) [Paramecium tetraurelia strain d4-2]